MRIPLTGMVTFLYLKNAPGSHCNTAPEHFQILFFLILKTVITVTVAIAAVNPTFDGGD